jgi:hypothetical protein
VFNSVSVVTRLHVGQSGNSGSDPGRHRDSFLTISRLDLRFTKPPIKWVPRVKQLEHEVDHFPLFSVEVKNVYSYISTSPHVIMLICLIN